MLEVVEARNEGRGGRVWLRSRHHRWIASRINLLRHILLCLFEGICGLGNLFSVKPDPIHLLLLQLIALFLILLSDSGLEGLDFLQKKYQNFSVCGVLF